VFKEETRRQKNLNKMVASIPQPKFALNFLMNAILICYRPLIFEFSATFSEDLFAVLNFFMILSCTVVARLVLFISWTLPSYNGQIS